MKKTFFSNAFLFAFLTLIISLFSITEAEAKRGKGGKKPTTKEKLPKSVNYIPIK